MCAVARITKLIKSLAKVFMEFVLPLCICIVERLDIDDMTIRNISHVILKCVP